MRKRFLGERSYEEKVPRKKILGEKVPRRKILGEKGS
jgi:hypothetical protein